MKILLSLRPAILLAFAICCAAPTVAAQNSDDIIRVDTELAAFEVTVTDKTGKPVRGLKAEDFRVIEDGEERKMIFSSRSKSRMRRARSPSFLRWMSRAV